MREIASEGFRLVQEGRLNVLSPVILIKKCKMCVLTRRKTGDHSCDASSLLVELWGHIQGLSRVELLECVHVFRQ